MKKTEFLFPVFVLIMSIISIGDNFSFSNIPSIVVSIIGIVGVLLFTFKRKEFKPLIYLWIIGQFIVIPNIWEVTQVFNFTFGFSFELRNQVESGLYFNFLPLFYLVGFRILEISTIVGTRIAIKRFQKESKLSKVLPIEGKVIKRVNLSGEKEWLLVNLEKPFTYLDSEVKSVFIKAKDDKPLHKAKRKQLSYLRIIMEPIDDTKDSFPKDNFKFIDWVMIEGK